MNNDELLMPLTKYGRYKGTLWKFSKLFITLGILAGLLFLSQSYYLMFHSIVEIFSVLIGFSVFIIALNTYEISQNDYFMFLGIAFGFISIFELLYALSYGGLDILKTNSMNLPSQFLIIASWMKALSLIISYNLIHKTMRIRKVFLVYISTSLIIMINIFYLKILPSYNDGGSGFTLFKIINGFIICVILIMAVLLLIKNRKKLYEKVYIFLLFGTCTTVISEIFYNSCTGEEGIWNIFGQIFKLVSMYLIYKAIIETSLRNPYKILFYKLSEYNNNLNFRTIELQQVNEKLLKENIERKSIEEQLRESKKNYQDFISFLPYATFAHCEGKFVFINNAGLKLLKVSSFKDIIGRPILDFIHSDYHQVFVKRMYQVYNGQPTNLLEQKFIASDGEVINVETKAVPYIFKGKPSGIVVVGDITERKIIEEKEKMLKEAVEYDRIKTEFFANISHELRTPLNVLFGAIQLMDFYSEKDIVMENKANIYKYIKNMKQNSYRMLRLVNNLIDLTKIDSGYLKLNLQNNNIVNVVEDIAISVAPYIESKSISIEFDTEVEEKIIACDGDIIERIILNLLSNAVKFTNPEGKICVNIYDEGENIAIAVKDTGIGIAKDKLSIIFDRFRQVDKSLTRSNEGSGIGLSLVKSLVEMHGGIVTVDSEYGKGTEFIIRLPAMVLPESEVACTSEIQQGKVERINIEFSDIYS